MQCNYLFVESYFDITERNENDQQDQQNNPTGEDANDATADANNFDPPPEDEVVGGHEDNDPVDIENVNIDEMDVSSDKNFSIIKKKFILKKIQQDFKAQKSYEVRNNLIYSCTFLKTLKYNQLKNFR